MADAIEAARAAYKRGNPFLTELDHDDALKAALAAADAERLKDASKVVHMLEEAASSEAMDAYGRDEVSRRLVREAAALITAQAARIEALERPSETMIKAATERLRECLNVLEVGDAPTRDFAHDVLEAAFAARATMEEK